ncbi:MAG TPA: oxidoreductase, partial [Verrucomicrobiales bacterium]|nr:oxidoreductase [Verrucomicrobiales bacterium]
GGFRIGAAVSCQALGEHAALKTAWPGVVEGAELIGSTQIQGRASMGGNLCNASPAADSVPGMVAAAATVTIFGPDGEREMPVEDFCMSPGQTSLSIGEMVAFINIPAPAPRTGDAYLRFIPRTEMDIAVAGAGISLSLDENGKCTSARVALGAVAERVLLVEEAASALTGTTIDAVALGKLASAASAAARPIDDKRGTAEYRTRVVGVLARRAAIIAHERAGGL